jgi:hypothetical protein
VRGAFWVLLARKGCSEGVTPHMRAVELLLPQGCRCLLQRLLMVTVLAVHCLNMAPDLWVEKLAAWAVACVLMMGARLGVLRLLVVSTLCKLVGEEGAPDSLQ